MKILNRSTLISVTLLALTAACSHTPPTSESRSPSNDFSPVEVDESALDAKDLDDNQDSIEPNEHFPADRYASANAFQRWLILTQLRGFYDNANGSVIPSIAMIEGARKTVDIEIYEMSDKDFLASIRRALARKVQVRIVKDPNPMGTDCYWFKDGQNESASCQDQKKLIAEIKDAGGSVVPFVKSELCEQDSVTADKRKATCFEHGKIIISDARRVLISTGNFNSSNLCNLKNDPAKCNRDYSFISKDREVIKRISQIFSNDLTQKRYEYSSLMTGDINEKITVSPYSLAPTIKLIQSAKESILIENQYLKHPDMNKAIFDAAKRGVKVRIVQASLCSFGKPNPKDIPGIQKLFQPFDDAGIETRMFTSQMKVGGKPGYLHAKVIVVDGKRAWLGSVNGSLSALDKNREYGIFFHRPRWVKKLKAVIEADLADANSETWQESITCAKDKEGSTPPSSTSGE